MSDEENATEKLKKASKELIEKHRRSLQLLLDQLNAVNDHVMQAVEIKEQPRRRK